MFAETGSILKEIRGTVVGDDENSEFDREILQHINSAITILNQNGVGKPLTVKGEDETWYDLKDETQIQGNLFFNMVPLYVTLKTQLLFDPPPPSNVQYHSQASDELLWRIKIAYET